MIEKQDNTKGKPTMSNECIREQAEGYAQIMSAAVDEALNKGGGRISASLLRPVLESHFKVAGIAFDPRMNRLALGMARRRMAAESEAIMREATKNWSPEKLARYSAERMRQLGELTRLSGDICKLPAPAEYSKTLAKQLEKGEIETVESASAWLKAFAAAYREAGREVDGPIPRTRMGQGEVAHE